MSGVEDGRQDAVIEPIIWVCFSAVVALWDGLTLLYLIVGGNDIWMLSARSHAVQADVVTALWMVAFILCNFIVAVRQFLMVLRGRA